MSLKGYVFLSWHRHFFCLGRVVLCDSCCSTLICIRVGNFTLAVVIAAAAGINLHEIIIIVFRGHGHVTSTSISQLLVPNPF